MLLQLLRRWLRAAGNQMFVGVLVALPFGYFERQFTCTMWPVRGHWSFETVKFIAVFIQSVLNPKVVHGSFVHTLLVY